SISSLLKISVTWPIPLPWPLMATWMLPWVSPSRITSRSPSGSLRTLVPDSARARAALGAGIVITGGELADSGGATCLAGDGPIADVATQEGAVETHAACQFVGIACRVGHAVAQAAGTEHATAGGDHGVPVHPRAGVEQLAVGVGVANGVRQL